MHRHTWILAISIAVGAQLLMPLAVRAQGADNDRLQAMDERLRALEDKLTASEATVQAQRELLQRSAPDVQQGGLDAFLSTLEIGGHVTSSYSYSFNNPDNTSSQVGSGAIGFRQFNTDQNSFSLDALKLELGRTAAEPGMAGFQLDLLFGENANILAAGSPTAAARFYNDFSTSNRSPGDTNVFVQQAYASYNYDGVMLKMGKFETLLGAEVLDSNENPNITQGLLFTYAIPLYHTGLLASGNFTESVDWAVGITNGFNNVNDYGDNKGVLGRVGFTQENMDIGFNVFVGSERTRTDQAGATVGNNNNRMQIYDVVANFKPMDGLRLWANVDYGFEELEPGVTGTPFTLPADEDAEWKAVALGAMFSLSDKTSVAVRGEWFRDEGGTRLPLGVVSTTALDQDITAISGTITLAHQLTENLNTRIEYRRDTYDISGPEHGPVTSQFLSSGDVEDKQDVATVEVNYVFD